MESEDHEPGSQLDLVWSGWIPHRGASRNREIPHAQGVYRIRRAGQQSLDYVGQTKDLRKRVGMLNGIYGDVMPYSDPHTAGPGFWALLQDEGCDFEIAVAEVTGDVVSRKGLESLVISTHRVEHARSPTLNFARMPDGWIKSSGNSAKLVAKGRRERGRRDPSAIRVPETPPPATLRVDPRSASWLGHEWSGFATSLPPSGTVGVYRLLRREETDLVYVGQGEIADRIKNHLAKGRNPVHRQYDYFAGDLVWDWVELSRTQSTQLQEIENDLIASHVLLHGHPPGAQFRG